MCYCISFQGHYVYFISYVLQLCSTQAATVPLHNVDERIIIRYKQAQYNQCCIAPFLITNRLKMDMELKFKLAKKHLHSFLAILFYCEHQSEP